MLKQVWAVGLGLLLTCAAASATKFDTKNDVPGWHADYFDASEVSTNVYVKITDDGMNSDVPRLYHFKVEPDWGQAPATLCVKVVEFKNIEKATFSSTRTAHFITQLINATKITKVTTFKSADYAQFGLTEADQFWLSYVYLTTGERITAIAPRDNSRYITCGIQNGEMKVNRNWSKVIERQTVLKNSCSGYTEPKDQVVISLSLDASFTFGDEAKALMEDCAVKDAAQKAKDETANQQAAQARIDADAQFEAEKAKHKMRTGVQLLGDMGADRAKRLVNNCEETPNFLQPNRGESSMTKEQWRQSRCGGYYKEEVADLLRELRIRGLVSN